jgi:DNA-binding MarR family transcriptional regulator
MHTEELASSLRFAVSNLHKVLRKQSDSVKDYSMTEIETIAHLSRSSLLPTGLAALTRITTQSMSQILKKLEGQGVIKRTLSKEDKRKVYISLTATGKKLVEKTRYDKDKWLKNAIEKGLTIKEKDLLIKALPVLNKLIETN